MARRDEVMLRVVAQWLTKADEDLEAAALLLNGMRSGFDVVGFHAQQAAEKSLKGYLVLLGMEPPRTHDVEELRNLIAESDPEMAAAIEGVVDLNPFGVVMRYVVVTPGLPESSAGELLELALHVRREVKQRLEDARESDEDQDALDADPAPQSGEEQ